MFLEEQSGKRCYRVGNRQKTGIVRHSLATAGTLRRLELCSSEKARKKN